MYIPKKFILNGFNLLTMTYSIGFPNNTSVFRTWSDKRRIEAFERDGIIEHDTVSFNLTKN